MTALRVQLAQAPGERVNRLVVYDWFARRGPPPRADNAVQILVDGEEAWGRVAQDLEGAAREVQIATWICRPDIELVRPAEAACSPAEARGSHRLGELIERLGARGVRTRLLIWGVVYTPIIDRWLFRWYWLCGHFIDLLEQDHPRLIGSFHQKTVSVDGRVAYCGGMNLKENDWDRSAHEVFDPRRCAHRRGAEHRRAVAEGRRRPDFPPRHDLMVRLEGPAVIDLLSNFHRRWRHAAHVVRRWSLARLPALLRRLLAQPPIADRPDTPRAQPPAGDRVVQIVRTMPSKTSLLRRLRKRPRRENAILDAYLRAIGNARRHVYIENQYFRSTVVAEALAQAMKKYPHLHVVAAVNRIGAGRPPLFDPAADWTARAQARLQAARPGFRLTELVVQATDVAGRRVYQPIDVHAKLMIVDDEWLTVGSANINDRGFLYEGEINAVVFDRRDARALRQRLMAEHLERPAEALADPDEAFALWQARAADNAERRQRGEALVGRVVAFTQRRPRLHLSFVGSDVF